MVGKSNLLKNVSQFKMDFSMKSNEFSVLDVTGLLTCLFGMLVGGGMGLGLWPQNALSISIMLGSLVFGLILIGYSLVSDNIEQVGWRGIIGIGVLFLLMNIVIVFLNNRDLFGG